MNSPEEPFVLDESFRSDPNPTERRTTLWSPAEAILLPILRSRRLVVILLLIGACVGLLVAALIPNAYTSTSKVLVRLGEREQGTPDTALADDRRFASKVVREDMQNEVHLFRNPAVFEQVAREVGAARILRPYDPAPEDPAGTALPVKLLHRLQSWWFGPEVRASGNGAPDSDASILAAVETLQDHVIIEGEPASSIVSVSATATSPELARTLADAFVRTLIDRHRKVFAGDESLAFLDTRVASARTVAMKADAALDDFKRTHGIFDLTVQSKNALDEISKLESEIASDEERFQALVAEEAFVKSLLANPSEPATPTPNPIPNLAYVHPLKEEIDKLQADLARVRSRFRESSAIRKTEEERITQLIAELEADLRQEPPLQQNGKIADVAAFERLQGRLEAIAEERQGRETSTKPRKERLQSLQNELLTMQALEPQYRALEMSSDQIHKQLVQFNDARDRAETISLLDQVKMSNLRVIQEATLPLTKTSPNRFKIAGIGAFLGLLVGIGLAFPRQVLDRTMRRPREAERALGLPVLQVVPDVPNLRDHSNGAGHPFIMENVR
ncbi:MAG: hypothetical protein HYR85_05005 [Planctomycetes bacterium]|nr:hypothetical protein [Planctomycetota bacterium]MBI3843447.1 hypothetical protein [Planctomycetota bacterium]